MRLKDLTFVAVRLLAIYIFIQGLGRSFNVIEPILPNLILSDEARVANPSLLAILLVYLIPGSIFIIISLILWFTTVRVVNLILHTRDSELDFNHDNLYGIFITGLSIVGIIVVVNGLPPLVMNIAQLFQIPSDMVTNTYRNNVVSALVSNLIKLILGLILVFRGGSIYRIIMKTKSE